MIPLIIILVIGICLVVVIWKFSNTKSTSYGIDVVTKSAKKKNYDIELDPDDKMTDDDELMPINNQKSDSNKMNIKKLDSSVEDDCMQMIVKNPKDINAYLRLSVFYIQRKKWSDAKEVLLEAKKIEEENDKILNNLGIVWYKLKRYNNAISAFESAIKLNDKIAHRYANLGLCYSALSENAKAADCFSKAVSLDPEHRDYQDLLAEAKSVLI